MYPTGIALTALRAAHGVRVYTISFLLYTLRAQSNKFTGLCPGIGW